MALHAPVPLAGAVGWGVGAVNGFVLNRAWTFRGARARRRARGALRRRRAAGLRRSTPRSLAIAVGDEHLPRLAGELAVLPPVTLLSFALCRGWVFAQAVPA